MNKDELSQIVDGLVDNLDIMINHSPSCLKLISRRGELIMMNKTGLDLIESPDMDSVLGADVYSIVEESHRQNFIEFNEHICKGNSGTLVFEVIGLRGTKRWMETYASPYILENGETAHIAITNDITELKNKKDLDKIISEVREKFIDYNKDPRKFYNFILDKLLELTKCEYGFVAEVTKEKTIQLKSYAITNIAWNEDTRNIYEESKHTGLIFDDMNTLFGEVVKTKELLFTNDPSNHPKAKGLPAGHPALNSFLGVPLMQSNQIIAMIGLANRSGGFDQDLVNYFSSLFQCISELVILFQFQQKNIDTEKKLKDLNNFLDLALEGSNIGVWEWNISDGSVRFDRRYMDIIGYDVDKVEHNFEFWQKLVHPDDLDGSLKIINDYLEGKTKQFVNPHRMKHADGRWIHILATGKISERENNGKPLRMAGTHADVTQEKVYKLELIEAKNNALIAEKAKTQFLANMSHEIRTPMNGVIGMLDLLKETPLNAEQEDIVNTIQYCGESLMTILNDVLDLTKIESGKLQLEKERFNINKVVSEVVAIFENHCIQKGLSIKIFSDLDHQNFYGDITRIKQILTNLVSNAVKFTRHGGIEVSISETSNSDSISNIKVQIKDTGIGISPENQIKLFKEFSQADESTTREFGGTGLGLSISKRLISLMNGSIDVVSELEVGSTFSISLPLILSNELPSNKASVHIKNDEFLNTKVLIVDDNEINCRLVSTMLSKLDIPSDIVIDGLEAVDRIGVDNKFGYTLVFMDLQMPVMDGYESTKKILENCHTNCPQIVPITADVFEDSRLKCKSIGMVDFLAKPFTQSGLKELLRRLQG